MFICLTLPQLIISQRRFIRVTGKKKKLFSCTDEAWMRQKFTSNRIHCVYNKQFEIMDRSSQEC